MAKKENQVKTNTEEIIEAAARKAAKDNREKRERKSRIRSIESQEHQGYPLKEKEEPLKED